MIQRQIKENFSIRCDYQLCDNVAILLHNVVKAFFLFDLGFHMLFRNNFLASWNNISSLKSTQKK